MISVRNHSLLLENETQQKKIRTLETELRTLQKSQSELQTKYSALQTKCALVGQEGGQGQRSDLSGRGNSSNPGTLSAAIFSQISGCRRTGTIVWALLLRTQIGLLPVCKVL